MLPYFKFGTTVVSTLKEFDGESSAESSSSSEKEAQNAVVPHCGRTGSSSDLLLAALLEHLCSLYVSDHRRRNQLFTLLYGQLKKMKLICPVTGLNELGSIRSQYKVGFMKLVQAALATVDKESHVALSADGQERVRVFLKPWQVPARLPSLLDVGLHTSRCDDEFAEICVLGAGGYGKVHKVRNKLDNCDYAIKKIYFRDKNPFVWVKVLREAKHLAGLSHKHIVRYYASWLEYSNPFTASATEQFQSSHLPALLCEAETTSTNGELDSSSHGVTFETFASEPPDNSHRSNHSKQYSHSYSCGHGNSACCQEDEASGDSPWCSASHCGIIKNACVVLHIQMELCTETLWHWLQERNTDISSASSGHDVYSLVNKENNAKILRQILKAVDYIHSHSIIHRDLKPKNIFLVIGDNGETQVKIGDFGLSRIAVTDDPLTPCPGHEAAAADTGSCYTSGVGTTSYAAPEQLNSCCYSTKSDMFSIGLIMFELYQPFITEMEKSGSLRQLRDQQQLAQEFTESWPEQARCIQKLVGVAEERPTAVQILQEEFLCSKDQIIANLRCKVTSQDEQIKLLQARISQLEQRLSEKEKQQSSQEATKTLFA
ncbi:Eukaryotic translation initiation factor 2-alpha kinase 1 [Lamellibrachia satsuma]|nr:Eukaryotic translation initiation factor 2-alpha kinase 1 [Lamellibrachia satsuma]